MCGQNKKKNTRTWLFKDVLSLSTHDTNGISTIHLFIEFPSTISKGLEPDLQEMHLSNETR